MMLFTRAWVEKVGMAPCKLTLTGDRSQVIYLLLRRGWGALHMNNVTYCNILFLLHICWHFIYFLKFVRVEIAFLCPNPQGERRSDFGIFSKMEPVNPWLCKRYTEISEGYAHCPALSRGYFIPWRRYFVKSGMKSPKEILGGLNINCRGSIVQVSLIAYPKKK